MSVNLFLLKCQVASNLIKLREVLTQHFDENELRTLCFDLGIDYDNLGSGGKADQVRELVGYFERRGRVKELEDTVKRLRPNAAWNDKTAGQAPIAQRRTAPETTVSQGKKHRTEIIVALIGAAAVIIAALMGLPWGNRDKVETPTPPGESFPYQVRVRNQETGEVIAGASVTIEVGGIVPLVATTDSEGVAMVMIDASRADKLGRLIVKAPRYEEYLLNINITEDALPQVIQLAPES